MAAHVHGIKPVLGPGYVEVVTAKALNWVSWLMSPNIVTNANRQDLQLFALFTVWLH